MNVPGERSSWQVTGQSCLSMTYVQKNNTETQNIGHWLSTCHKAIDFIRLDM